MLNGSRYVMLKPHACLSSCLLETGSQEAQANFELLSVTKITMSSPLLLPLPLQCWHYRSVLPASATFFPGWVFNLPLKTESEF